MLISGLQRTSAAAASGSWQVPWARGPNPRFPIWPGIGEGNARFPIRPKSRNGESPFPDLAGTGNRGPHGGGAGNSSSWSRRAAAGCRQRTCQWKIATQASAKQLEIAHATCGAGLAGCGAWGLKRTTVLFKLRLVPTGSPEAPPAR
jgi:hypothetical protein